MAISNPRKNETAELKCNKRGFNGAEFVVNLQKKKFYLYSKNIEVGCASFLRLFQLYNRCSGKWVFGDMVVNSL